MSISAILVATVIYFGIGPIWYGAFGKPWLKELGLKANEINRKDPRPYLVGGLTSFLSAIGLAYTLSIVQPDHVGGAIGISMVYWAFFSAATLGKHYAFGQKSAKLFQIDSGYDAVSFAAMGAAIFWMS